MLWCRQKESNTQLLVAQLLTVLWGGKKNLLLAFPSVSEAFYLVLQVKILRCLLRWRWWVCACLIPSVIVACWEKNTMYYFPSQSCFFSWRETTLWMLGIALFARIAQDNIFFSSVGCYSQVFQGLLVALKTSNAFLQQALDYREFPDWAMEGGAKL